MNKKSFFGGYLLGLLLALALSAFAIRQTIFAQPDISYEEMGLLDLDGRPVPAASLRGQPVVVNYWATWCGGCIEEFPAFEQAQRQVGSGVRFIMVSDEPPAKIKAFLRKHPYPFTFLRLRRPLPRVNVRPATYAFNRQGEVVEKELGSFTSAQGVLDIARAAQEQ